MHWNKTNHSKSLSLTFVIWTQIKNLGSFRVKNLPRTYTPLLGDEQHLVYYLEKYVFVPGLRTNIYPLKTWWDRQLITHGKILVWVKKKMWLEAVRLISLCGFLPEGLEHCWNYKISEVLRAWSPYFSESLRHREIRRPVQDN